MKNDILKKSDLAQFTGTEHWYRHDLVPNMLHTDGIRYMARTAGAYWLIDEIVFSQHLPIIVQEKFKVWTLRVNLPASSATLECGNGNGKVVFSKAIPYTDFPIDEIRCYCVDNVILLTSEY